MSESSHCALARVGSLLGTPAAPPPTTKLNYHLLCMVLGVCIPSQDSRLHRKGILSNQSLGIVLST